MTYPPYSRTLLRRHVVGAQTKGLIPWGISDTQCPTGTGYGLFAVDINQREKKRIGLCFP